MSDPVGGFLSTLPDATAKAQSLPVQRTMRATPAKPYGAKLQGLSHAEQIVDDLTGGAYSMGRRAAEQVHQGSYAGALQTTGRAALTAASMHPAVREALAGIPGGIGKLLAPAEDAAPASNYSLPELPPEAQRGPQNTSAMLERVMKSGPIFDPEEAAAARTRAPGIAADSVASRAMSSADMLRNMQESGFASGVPSTGVVLPTSGAGRAGTTTASMAAARQAVDPDTFRSMVNTEIARRGGATSPEVTMAATEQVARNLASQPSVFQPQN